MIRKRLVLASCASAVGLTTMLVAPASAMPTPAPASAPKLASPAIPHAVGIKVHVDAAAILAYWTPARRAAAKNMDIITVKAAPRTESVRPVHAGQPGSVPGGLPGGATAPVRISPSVRTPDSFTYPYPYDSWTVPNADYAKYPWLVNGKIFFTNNGVNSVCSGTVVGSVSGTSNENEVWTAGHCLINTASLTGIWDSSLEFIPGYNGSKVKGQSPKGIYTWTGAAETNTAWLNNRDLSEDEAAFTVNPNGAGQILGNRTGWAGFAWNQNTDEQFNAFGYPQDSPYNGNTMITDEGASAVLDTGAGGAGTTPIGIGNPMTAGSSGGGWMIDWTDTGTGYVDGHNDYKYGSQPLAMYSPYQDTLSNTVRCFGAASC